MAEDHGFNFCVAQTFAGVFGKRSRLSLRTRDRFRLGGWSQL